jgi:hypothetical protein
MPLYLINSLIGMTQCHASGLPSSFLFGETELITLPHLVTRFSLLTQGRDYIIVEHGAREDIKVFNHLGLNIANQACYIMDTVKAA